MARCRLLEKFRRLFRFSSTASTQENTAAEPAPISDTERLSRYITNKGEFSVTKNEVGFRAFLPASKDVELSIMRTEHLSEAEVWAHADTFIAQPSGRTIYARGDFLAPDVRASIIEPWRLDVQPDDDPPRHALIVGWPPATELEIRKSLAQQVRAKARLHVRQHA
jgi:hypothetical protein